jgi:hypothetical protein
MITIKLDGHIIDQEACPTSVPGLKDARVIRKISPMEVQNGAI